MLFGKKYKLLLIAYTQEEIIMGEKEDYIEKTLMQDLKRERIVLSEAQKEEFRGEIKNGKKRKISVYKFITSLFLFGFIFLLVGGFVAYIFIAESIHLSKPELSKPDQGAINSDQIKYMLQSAGAYKLHSSPITGEPAIINVWIKDTGQRFTATSSILDSDLVVKEENSDNYDMKLSVDDKTFRDIFSVNETNKEVVRQIARNRLQINQSVSKIELALKGYPGFNNVLKPDDKKLFFFTSTQLRMIYLIVVIVMTILTLLYLRM